MNMRVRERDPNSAPAQLTHEAKRALDELVLRAKMRKKDLLSELVLWLSKLEDEERIIVLGQIREESAADVAALVVRRKQRRAREAVRKGLRSPA